MRTPAHDDTILRLLQLGNGTWKDTYQGRFAPLDAALVDLLASTRASGSSLIVTDLAVSSGTTSVELYRALRPRFALDFLATDLWRDAFAVRDLRRGWTVVVDNHGRDLQYVIGPFVLPGQGREAPIYPVNHLLRWLARRLCSPQARAVFARHDGRSQGNFASVRLSGFEITRIPLLSSDCLTLLQGSGDFRVEVADILEPLGRRSDVLRALNILTPFHFGPEELRRGVRNCLGALQHDGLLVLGRSATDAPEDLRATIYRAEDSGLRPVATFNGGCEIDALVLEEAGRLARGR